MTELKNPIEFHTFCKQAQITPMRYRHLVNLGKVPPVVAGQVDFVLAIMSLYKIFRAGGQYLEDKGRKSPFRCQIVGYFSCATAMDSWRGEPIAQSSYNETGFLSGIPRQHKQG